MSNSLKGAHWKQPKRACAPSVTALRGGTEHTLGGRRHSGRQEEQGFFPDLRGWGMNAAVKTNTMNDNPKWNGLPVKGAVKNCFEDQEKKKLPTFSSSRKDFMEKVGQES